MAVPTKDSKLVNYSTNFDTRVTAAPTTFGLTAAQATQYGTLHDAFIEAYNAMNMPGMRSPSLVAAKNTAKGLLVDFARELYGFVQANTSVSDANKVLLGVVVRSAPSPQPAPVDPPAMDIVSVMGRTVKVRLHDSTDSTRKGRPPGVKGAALFSFTGAVAPTDPSLFSFEGNSTRTVLDIDFPDTLAPGAQVWITAMWFSDRALSGPACTPVGVQFGAASMAA